MERIIPERSGSGTGAPLDREPARVPLRLIILLKRFPIRRGWSRAAHPLSRRGRLNTTICRNSTPSARAA